VLRNKGVGGIFYDVGLIEQWGSGIDKMRKACVNAELPEPRFEEYQGFRVIFGKDIYTEEYLRGLGLNERQIRAVMYVKKRGNINLSSFKTLVPEFSDKTLYRDLQDLVVKGILKELGEKKGRRYELE
jgi:ATP-dependent DNA helicase RecG